MCEGGGWHVRGPGEARARLARLFRSFSGWRAGVLVLDVRTDLIGVALVGDGAIGRVILGHPSRLPQLVAGRVDGLDLIDREGGHAHLQGARAGGLFSRYAFPPLPSYTNNPNQYGQWFYSISSVIIVVAVVVRGWLLVLI